jgi:acetyl esterase/lipase
VVALAGLVDLVEGSRRELIGGENVIAKLLGGSAEEVPDRYAAASPRALLPLGVPHVLVQGLADYIHDLVDQNRAYLRAARASGDSATLVEIERAEHLDLIEPSSAGWPHIVGAIEQAVARRVA